MYKDKIRTLVKYYAQNFFMVLVWGILATFITGWTKKEFDFSVWDTNYSGVSYLKKNGLLLSFWMLVIKIPIIEEMAFRLFLKVKRTNLLVSTFFLTYLLFGLLSSNFTVINRLLYSLQ